MRNLYPILKDAMRGFFEDNAIQLAAALSFYAVSAIPPLLVGLVQMLNLLSTGPQAEDYLLYQARWLLGARSLELLRAVLEQSHSGQEEGIAVAGILLLLVSVGGFFFQLQAALNRIWKVETSFALSWKENVLKRALSMGVVVGTGFIVLASILASAILGAAGETVSNQLGISLALAKAGQFLVSLALLAVVFALLFRLLPDAKVSWRSVWSGAMLAALLFSASKGLFGWCLGYANPGARYGAAGAVVLLLFWIDFACLIFLFGAEWTQVIHRRNQE